MKYWVRLDKERIMKDYDEESLLEGSGTDSIYLIRQLRLLILHGEGMFAVDEESLLMAQSSVYLKEDVDGGMYSGVYVPCFIVAPVDEVFNG